MLWCCLVIGLATVLLTSNLVAAQFDPHFLNGSSAIVHLFEWKWDDVARECEGYLRQYGVGGVQVSPPNEYSVIEQYSRPWWERYQPVSYTLKSRSGNEDRFRSMVERCRNSGVRVYVDAVINHMSATIGKGTAGSKSDPVTMNYPGVPYSTQHFHTPCQIEDYNDPFQVRNCQLVGLPDLNHHLKWVQDRVVEYLNKLIDSGVAGFRVDAAKHMWPEDLKVIYSRLDDLSTDHGFPPGSRPFIYQEVIDLGGEGVSKYEYTGLGRVTEFRASAEIGRLFRGKNNLTFMDSWGPAWGFMNSSRAVVFVENHDSERGQGAGGADVLTYKDKTQYMMAVAFTIAHPFGVPKVMSSFEFNDKDDGPPKDKSEEIISPKFDNNETCGNGWVCQHRWPQIGRMIKFRNFVEHAPISNWWSNGKNQIAFGRRGKGFIAFNNEEIEFIETLNVGLPNGIYCDIISGERLKDNSCSGQFVEVDQDGMANINLLHEDGVLAISLETRIDLRSAKSVILYQH